MILSVKTTTRSNYLHMTVDEALALQEALTATIRHHLATGGMISGMNLENVFRQSENGDGQYVPSNCSIIIEKDISA
jgi:hypothetical protein